MQPQAQYRLRIESQVLFFPFADEKYEVQRKHKVSKLESKKADSRLSNAMSHWCDLKNN